VNTLKTNKGNLKTCDRIKAPFDKLTDPKESNRTESYRGSLKMKFLSTKMHKDSSIIETFIPRRNQRFKTGKYVMKDMKAEWEDLKHLSSTEIMMKIMK